MRSFYGIKEKDLADELVSLGYSKFSSSQIFDWVYRKKVKDFNLMSNIKKELREYLVNNYSLELPEIAEKQVSSDDTTKYLLRLSDNSLIETVLMYHDYGISLCVTSEVGLMLATSANSAGTSR